MFRQEARQTVYPVWDIKAKTAYPVEQHIRIYRK